MPGFSVLFQTPQLKGPVEKGVSAIQLNIGIQAGFHVRNTVVHSLLDLRSQIQRISILLLCKKFC